jgi:hypothetical protein
MVRGWEKLLGLTSSATVTATEDGFRVVLVSLRDYSDTQPEPEPESTEEVVTIGFDEFDFDEDEEEDFDA